MTLTTALHLYRGGSPKGPAGTGKTETVKDLGKSLGMYVIVINCSEGLDYKSMGRMFSGLAQVFKLQYICIYINQEKRARACILDEPQSCIKWQWWGSGHLAMVPSVIDSVVAYVAPRVATL